MKNKSKIIAQIALIIFCIIGLVLNIVKMKTDPTYLAAGCIGALSVAILDDFIILLEMLEDNYNDEY